MQAVRDLIETIPALAGRVHGAAQLGRLLEKGGLAQAAPAAFVLPLGLSGGAADAAAGLYRQPIVRLIGVVLFVRVAGDATGDKAFAELEPLIEATIAAIAGTDTADSTGVFTLRRGELINVASGALSYQLDFAIDEQLRISR